jgi:hypothetical protein
MKMNAIGFLVKTNPKQSQTPAFGRKFEALHRECNKILGKDI